MSVGHTRIAKNMSVMMASQVVTWGLSFILAIFLPRYLGASIIGEISIAYSIWAITSVLVSFGMDTHLTKTIARNPERTPEILGTSLLLRTAFFLIASIFVSLYLFLLEFNHQTVYIVAIIGITTLLNLLIEGVGSAIIGIERMDINALSGSTSKVISTVLTLLLIFLGTSVYFILSANLLASIVALLIGGGFLIRQQRFELRFQIAQAREMLRLSLPYLVTALLLVAYQQLDNLFIAALVDTRTVGWYSTATTLFGTMMFIPVIFGTVLFPTLSRTYANDTDHFSLIARRSFDLMFLLSVPIGMGIVVISGPAVLLLYGPEFAQSGPVLAILGIVLIFTYLNTLLGQLIISTDKTARWNVVMMVAIFLTIPLDLVLVPWTHNTFGNGALGGTVAYLITEAVMVIGAVLLLPKHTLQWSNVRTAALSLVAGLLMMAASWWWRDTMMLLSILVGAVSYSALVFVLRIVPRDDLLLLKDMGLQLLSRLRRTNEASAGVGN